MLSLVVVEKVGDVFFFFQAEDGIRDIGVTGVQTCALPILVNSMLQLDFMFIIGEEFYIPQLLPKLSNQHNQQEIGRASCRERV